MQQLDTLRERFDPNGRWFRVGVVSATAVAPLIARWNDLRADKHAAELREQAEARLGDMRARLKSGANDMLRQAGPIAERLPFVQTKPPKPKRSANTGLWLAGVAVGLVAAGVTAYVVARRRLAIPEDEESMVELPLNGANDVWPSTVPSAEPAMTKQVSTSPAEAQDETAEDGNGMLDIDSTEDAEATRFVGNIHTMIFHDADDEEHLPDEENRIYFATEDEAYEAGFRRARSERAFSDEAHVGSAEAPNA